MLQIETGDGARGTGTYLLYCTVHTYLHRVPARGSETTDALVRSREKVDAAICQVCRLVVLHLFILLPVFHSPPMSYRCSSLMPSPSIGQYRGAWRSIWGLGINQTMYQCSTVPFRLLSKQICCDNGRCTRTVQSWKTVHYLICSGVVQCRWINLSPPITPQI